jgi:predicted nucleic acid-binding protein
MSGLAIDTSVLLAILKGEARGNAWLQSLQTEAESGTLLVSTVVLSEVRSFYSSDGPCREALFRLNVHHSPLTAESALLAGQIFRAYRAEGGPRKTILPDFLVAAHAVTQARALATEDRGFLQSYFPTIRLIALPTNR